MSYRLRHARGKGPGLFLPRPVGERVPGGRVRGWCREHGWRKRGPVLPPHPIPLPVGARAMSYRSRHAHGKGPGRFSPSPRWGEGARRAGEGAVQRARRKRGPVLSPHPIPLPVGERAMTYRWRHARGKGPGLCPPRPVGERVPAGRVRGRAESTAGESVGLCFPSPHPSPRWGEGDELSVAPCSWERPGAFSPSPRWGEGARRAGEGACRKHGEIVGLCFPLTPSLSPLGRGR